MRQAWKIPDEKKLACRIQRALIALYQAEHHLPPGEPLDSKLRLEFRIQIDRLRTKWSQISGPEVLQQFDTQRGVQVSGVQVNGVQDNSAQLNGAQVNSVQVSGVQDNSAQLNGAQVNGVQSTVMASLPTRMSNEQLAHELALDPTFQLDEGGGCSAENPLYQRIRGSFHRAFWDSLVDDLCLDMPCYTRVLRVLAEIRDGIHDLAGTRDSCNIMEVIDLDYICQQAERGLYGWPECTRLISGIFGVIQQVFIYVCLVLLQLFSIPSAKS